MSDFEQFYASLGMPLKIGPAATAYKQARDLEELHIAAGEHLALHAEGIMQALPLPRRGSICLRAMKALSKTSWREYWRLNNEAFCRCALIDLCSVRQFFMDAGRWPELSPLLDQAFIMACVYLGHVIKMNEEEKALLQSTATNHLMDFQDSPHRTAQEQLAKVMEIHGIEKQKINTAAFIRQAIVQQSRLEPVFIIQEYDRINKAQQDGAGNAAPRRA
jgi:hypothetical protein